LWGGDPKWISPKKAQGAMEHQLPGHLNLILRGGEEATERERGGPTPKMSNEQPSPMGGGRLPEWCLPWVVEVATGKEGTLDEGGANNRDNNNQ